MLASLSSNIYVIFLLKICFGHMFGQERAISGFSDPGGLLPYNRAHELVLIESMS